MGNSLIFSGSPQNLTITGKTGINQQKFTIAFWYKLTSLAAGAQEVYIAWNGSLATSSTQVSFTSSGNFSLASFTSSATEINLVTSATHTDTTSWHHYLVAVDTTQATSTNRALVYVDGTQVTSFSTATYPALNTNLSNNFAGTYGFGSGGGANYINGKVAELYYIDGQQLTPSSFITGAPGIPMTYTGTYAGIFDFYLNFSNDASTTTLGLDSSGESNNWTLNNMTTANQSADYPGVVDWFDALTYPWNSPVRTRWFNVAHQPHQTSPAMQPLPHWFLPVPLAEPVRIPLRAIQQHYIYLQANIAGPATSLRGWYNWLTEPVKLKPGLAATLQQFLALSPRLLPKVNVTATMAATEIDTDVAEFGVDVYTPEPSAPSLAGANVSILQLPAMNGGYLSIEGGD